MVAGGMKFGGVHTDAKLSMSLQKVFQTACVSGASKLFARNMKTHHA